MRQIVTRAIAAVLAIAACAAIATAAGDATPRPAGYRAAVEAALARRGIEQSGVRVADGCEPTHQACRRYRGDVTVLVWRPVRGVIACRWRWTGCALTLPELGIQAEPLVDRGLPLGRQDLEQLARDWFAAVRWGGR